MVPGAPACPPVLSECTLLLLEMAAIKASLSVKKFQQWCGRTSFPRRLSLIRRPKYFGTVCGSFYYSCLSITRIQSRTPSVTALDRSWREILRKKIRSRLATLTC